MQRKLSLNLDDLAVDSFDTITAEKPKGTVFGEQCTCYTNCTCPGCPTCYASCNGTCGASCAATCVNTCDDYTCGCNDTQEETCQVRCTQTAQYTHCGDIVCY